MPTGFTADVIEKDISFREFAINCMRAFTPMASVRDEPMDKLITEIPLSSYYQDRLDEAIKAKADFTAIGKAGQVEWAKAEIVRRLAGAQQYVNSQETENSRLSAMIAKVSEWKPPTSEHERYKAFMLEQLEMSLNTGNWALESLEKAGTATVMQVIEDHMSHLARDVAYYFEHAVEAKENNRKANEWIKATVESLPKE